MKWYSDPGHAWLKVKLSELKRLGIANKISSFSYMKGPYVFLEEDCDAAIYLEASGKHTRDFEEESTNLESPIRDFCCYQPI